MNACRVAVSSLFGSYMLLVLASQKACQACLAASPVRWKPLMAWTSPSLMGSPMDGSAAPMPPMAMPALPTAMPFADANASRMLSSSRLGSYMLLVFVSQKLCHSCFAASPWRWKPLMAKTRAPFLPPPPGGLIPQPPIWCIGGGPEPATMPLADMNICMTPGSSRLGSYMPFVLASQKLCQAAFCASPCLWKVLMACTSGSLFRPPAMPPPPMLP
mmetsp:Transcript_29532/g.77359  ORF Transcript_29532/g.77359 Transcript_29532/m.77359 type:complete len:216 (-) Transcript_29532:836-1483(-)